MKPKEGAPRVVISRGVRFIREDDGWVIPEGAEDLAEKVLADWSAGKPDKPKKKDQ